MIGETMFVTGAVVDVWKGSKQGGGSGGRLHARERQRPDGGADAAAN
jgi:hypothetical protein